MKPKARLLILVLLAGMGAWYSTRVFGSFLPSPATWPILISGVAMLTISPVRGNILETLEPIRTPTPKVAWLIAFGIFAITVGYLRLNGLFEERSFLPLWHDERSYLLQTRMFSEFHLWMPPHPLGEIIQSHYVFTTPVYSSMYFPGTALLNVPGMWLVLPTWFMPLILTGALAAMVYRIATELFDGWIGLAVALLIIGSSTTRYLSIMVMSNIPTALLGSIVFYGFLRWQKESKVGWLITMSIAAGWMLITRPLEALCLLLPMTAAIFWTLRRSGVVAWAKTIGIGLACVAPFVALQVALNQKITGSPTQFPHDRYVSLYFPGANFGFHPPGDPADIQTGIPQVRKLYEINVGRIRDHYAAGLPNELRLSVGNVIYGVLDRAWLTPLLFAGLLALLDRRAWVLVAYLFLFVLAYGFSCWQAAQYGLALIPAVAVMLGAAIHIASTAFPKAGRAVEMGGVLLIVALIVGGLPELVGRKTDDRLMKSQEHTAVEDTLRNKIDKPALVLFRFHPNANVHLEYVYNHDTPWPDDAAVVRAHDLGPEKTRQLLTYYLSQGDDRMVYFMDRGSPGIHTLGPASSLLANLDAFYRQVPYPPAVP